MRTQYLSRVCMSLWMLFIFLYFPLTTAVQGADPSQPAQNGAEAVPPDFQFEVQEKNIDKAGEKIGEKIGKFEAFVSQNLGKWVGTRLFFGITWLKLLICATLVFLVLLADRFLKAIIRSKIKTIPHKEGAISWLRLTLQALERPLSLFIKVYGIYFAVSPLFVHFRASDGSNMVHVVAQRAADIAGTMAVVWFIYSLVQVLDARITKWAEGTESTIDDILVPLVGKTLRVVIVIVGSMVIVQNLTGVEIGPLLASLGIGGLAVALAAKDSIANFFGTLTILFDKPFQVGERIVIDSFDGVVEAVGFRSTRIRTLTGHLVTVPNEKLVNTFVENIGRRPHIRWLTNIGITYDTPAEKIREAVQILETLLADHEGMHPDFPPRVYFNGFNDWSLNIMVVAWYHPADFWRYQTWLQRLCLEIVRRFNSAGINFAFPSRTVYVAGDDARRLNIGIETADKGFPPV